MPPPLQLEFLSTTFAANGKKGRDRKGYRVLEWEWRRGR